MDSVDMISAAYIANKASYEATEALNKRYSVTTAKVWSTSLDGCGCLSCAKLEGKIAAMEEPFCMDGVSVLFPPLHDGCSCTVEYVEDPGTQLRRDFDSAKAFAEITNESTDFQAVAISYFAVLYFLQKLVDASPAELDAAGLETIKGKPLCRMLRKSKSHKDNIFNGAIERAFDYELSEAQKLKTESGQMARMERFRQEISGSPALSAANLEFLNALFKKSDL